MSPAREIPEENCLITGNKKFRKEQDEEKKENQEAVVFLGRFESSG
jgi:hypothetical protein